jgi:hypothetical protein
MIDKQTASAQILRLTGLRFFPKDDRKALEELIAALAQSAKTPEHAKAVIDAWLHDSAEVLVPAQIYQLAQRLAPEETASCSRCDGTGFINTTIRHRGESYPAVEPCPECRRREKGTAA